MTIYPTLETTTPIPSGHHHAYTDGSSQGLSGGAAGWAWYTNDTQWQAGSLIGTNNTAELDAIRHALMFFPYDEPLVLICDSEYAVKAITVWWRSWNERGWTTATGDTVANRGLIEATRWQLQQRTARTLFKMVRGHGKDPDMLPEDVHGNALADMLAKAARAEGGPDEQAVLLDPIAWDIINGRGRKRKPFLERSTW